MAGLLDPRQGDGSYVENRPSKWQQTWDILSPYVTGPAYAVKGLMDTPLEVLMGAPGTEAAQDEAVANAFNAAGSVMLGGSVVPKPSNAMNMGIRAYHGSPHSFDKFDMSKIGTGEGAQAYGHGLYFAENEGVAKGYRDTLAPAPTAAQEAAQRAIDQYGDASTAADEIARMVNEGGLLPETVDHYKTIEAILRGEASASPGSMYEVEINADPNAFLDWDKPLSEQPGFLNSLTNYDPDYNVDYEERLGKVFQSLQPVSEPLGQDFYAELARGNKKGAAAMLKNLGVPGIKYLDAGSRGAGDGTRNYVVFDDNLIEILRKYGIAGLLGGGASMSAMGQPQEQY